MKPKKNADTPETPDIPQEPAAPEPVSIIDKLPEDVVDRNIGERWRGFYGNMMFRLFVSPATPFGPALPQLQRRHSVGDEAESWEVIGLPL